MSASVTIGQSNPFTWVTSWLATRRAEKAARATMLRELGICTVCHANVASAETDYRCNDCDLECASVP